MLGGNAGNFGIDLGALLGNALSNGNNGDFGGNGAWWIIVILFALWGRNGNGLLGGDNGTNSQTIPATAGDLQRGFDTQTVVNKLNGLENGICNLGYDQLSQMNGLTNTVTQTGWGIQQSLQNLMVALMQQGFNQSSQTKDCCCTVENLLQQANYNRQADTCTITNAINQMAQSIIANDNANYRQLHEENVQLQMQNKDAQIAALTQQLNRCYDDNTANSVVARLTNVINPPVTPAYIVQNPNGCNCNNSNGCCNNNWGNVAWG